MQKEEKEEKSNDDVNNDIIIDILPYKIHLSMIPIKIKIITLSIFDDKIYSSEPSQTVHVEQ